MQWTSICWDAIASEIMATIGSINGFLPNWFQPITTTNHDNSLNEMLQAVSLQENTIYFWQLNITSS